MRTGERNHEKTSFRRARGAVFEGVTEDDFYRENYSAGA